MREISAVSQLQRVFKSSIPSHAGTKDSGIQKPESDPFNQLATWNYSISNWLQILLHIHLHSSTYSRHIISQMKYAKSYKYLMQHTAVLLFCADTSGIILLYYFRYKILSKPVCFHPLLHSFVADSSTKFPIDLISSLTNCSFYFSEVWHFPSVDINLSDEKEINAAACADKLARNIYHTKILKLLNSVRNNNFSCASECVSGYAVCEIKFSLFYQLLMGNQVHREQGMHFSLSIGINWQSSPALTHQHLNRVHC